MEIKILKENAVAAYNSASNDGKKLLENLFGKHNLMLPPREWVKSFSDVCMAAGVNESDYALSECLTEEQRLTKAVMRERLIAKVFNTQADGSEWKPNWANNSEKKWRIWVNTVPDKSSPRGFRLSFDAVYDFFDDCSILGARLYFKNEDDAIYVGKNLLHELSDSIIY